MEILITSKTHKGKSACVGGLIIATNRYVRLLNSDNWDQYADTILSVGDVWNIDFLDRPEVEPPHVEDIIVQSKHFVRKIGDISDFLITSGVIIFRGAPTQIFGGLLGWTGTGSGYIGNRDDLPVNSVGFWISDKDLTLDEDGEHYNYPSRNPILGLKRLKYVGFAPKVKQIPSGTLMRVSLARWWRPVGSEMEERCYLQLSGWYGLNDSANIDTVEELPW